MSDYMEELATAWVGWVRHRTAVQDKVLALIQKTNARFEDDEELRKSELKRLQKSLYRVAIADRLLDKAEFCSTPPKTLLGFADVILNKRGHVPGTRGKPDDMRTPDEERYYGAARVRWCDLLKKADVPPADDRGGDRRH